MQQLNAIILSLCQHLAGNAKNTADKINYLLILASYLLSVLNLVLYLSTEFKAKHQHK
ncbi:hypothetical protein N478_23040 [Pseudoalteromonas luteoviolacea S4060-1]|uniref:Uncharacterized protein n=1 Tax=Pseudoalteromonas luteoviolacea S4060-1 TaxID=1365257 RepID=A0A167LA04_9GAMM|nr:hypothetical protein N478_23040 [Pseudoalteromonas luteoviolacea S4060-1]